MTEETALYRLFSSADELLYVGITLDPSMRFQAHSSRAWWPEVTRSILEWWPSLELAKAAEKRAIETERPIHNRALVVPAGDHAQRCTKIASLRDQMDEAEAYAQSLRNQLLAAVAEACQGAGPGVATEVAQYARWSPAHVRKIRDAKITPRAYVADIRDGKIKTTQEGTS